AEKEYGDTTYCFSVWKDEADGQHYYGHRFDRYGNWIESVSTVVDDHACAGVRVREITYYRDIEVMGLQVGVKTVTNKWKADGKNWSNRYDFDREGNLLHFQSWCDKEPLFEWDINTDTEPGCDLIVSDKNKDVKRKITYWK
ncbi:MAG: hypothetical protein IJS43_01855, partial [Bacteroidaceae bacterium]|nr:hypothetical protein [Bacteroidaceae bacterium]